MLYNPILNYRSVCDKLFEVSLAVGMPRKQPLDAGNPYLGIVQNGKPLGYAHMSRIRSIKSARKYTHQLVWILQRI